MPEPAFRFVYVVRLVAVVFFTVPVFLDAQSAQAQVAQPASQTKEQGDKAATSGSKELPPELARIVDASRQAPPEFHAYALLLLAESGRVQAKPAAMRLVRETFESAQSAGDPVEKMLAVNGLAVESDVGVWMFKRRFGLDRTTLMARAVTDAEKLDPAAARAMLEEARWAEMEPSSCTSALAADPEAYFKMMTLLAHNKAANSKDGKDASGELLEPAVRKLKTHRQVELALRLVTEADLVSEQREVLARTLASQLMQVQDDDRGFAALMLDRSFNGWIHELKRSFEQLDETAARAFLGQFRAYLVENLKAGGCGAAWLRKKDAAGKTSLPQAIEAFNEQLRAELQRSGLEPIAITEVESHTPVVEAKVNEYGKSVEAKNLMQALKRLRFDTTNARRSLDDLNSSAWTEQATNFLGKVDDWPADPFNSVDVFWMKMEFYTGVIDLAPKEDMRWLAMEKAVAQLENSRLESEDPASLMVFAFMLHIRATSQMNGDERQKRSGHDLVRRLAASQNPSLHLLGLLETERLKPIPNSF